MFALALAPVVHGEVFSVQPTQPRFQEPVNLHVDQVSDFYIPDGAQISMLANTITVALRGSGLSFPPGGVPFDVPLGRFPAGDYDIQVINQRGPAGSPVLATLHFHVGDAPSLSLDVPLGDFSDLWWTPSESGWGLTIVQHPSSNIFAAWFVYGSDGKPIWYVLPGGSWTHGTFSGDLYRTTGPYYGGAFNPANVAATRAGTASLRFSDLSHGTLSYNVDGVTGMKAIQREAF